MANNEKKYAGLTALQTFKNNLDNLFATKATVDNLSTNVAYINEEDNENITDVGTNITVDSALSETSTNPVQNKVITEKINEVSEAISNKADKAGWTPDKYISTDANGNLIETDITEIAQAAANLVDSSLLSIIGEVS